MDAARFRARCGSGWLAGSPIVGMEVAVNPAVNHPQDRGPAELAGLSRGGVGRRLIRPARR
jgi:translation elongation factor EF-G